MKQDETQIETEVPQIQTNTVNKAKSRIRPEIIDPGTEKKTKMNLPEVYSKGFYKAVLDNRVARGEDAEKAEVVKKIAGLGRPIPKEWFCSVAIYLFHAFPLLQSNYSDLFDIVIRRAIECFAQDPEEFMKSILVVCDFIAPGGSFRVMPFETLEEDCIRPCENPIGRLEVLHTLRVFQDQEPFCHFSFLKDEMTRAEVLLAEYDLCKYVKMAKSGPNYLQEYVDLIEKRQK